MRKLAWVVAGVVVAGAGFAVVSTAGAEAGGRYRVASVTVGDVAQTVPVSGTVDRVNRADVSFGTSGSLATLSVGVGDPVSAGQELASLDTASLQAAVDKAELDVDQSESTLASASEAVEEATSPSSSSSSPSSSPSSSSSSSSSAPQPSADSATGRLVQAVKDAQSVASAALRTATDAMAAQEAACADPTAQACAAAGAATLKAQQAVKSAQDTLQGKLDALSSALSAAQSSSESSSKSSSESSSESSTRSGSSDSRSGPSDSSASATSVAEAQAAVDQAKVKLVEAQQALAGATLKSPISGTVAAVSATVGDQVSTGTAVVVVVGEGAADVTATVPVEQLTKLKVGQPATVTPVGTSQKVTGTVTRVSTTPDPNAESVAYPVTITVDRPPMTMAAGSSTTASVVVATAKNVLTVPTSAVTRNTVTVLTGDQTTLTPVTVGAVGPTRTEIKEGLSRGQQVVLADLDTPLPTADSSSEGGFLRGGPEGGPEVGRGGQGGGPVVRKGPGN
ncbi:efflux RND transporter periplasmic adaptor subunit [Actinophytocola sp.]|uniref:efflux RND transporter periplasmic adaptor subunit n=1 Tax=Actinophytocola sp. TaxID=1872138 RepID=UPI002D29F997|nr:HlyD family efflux transporter periplasmic adaptor subunit [Actinophytocola sp.]HYQ65589.1 HlyD family efflux transporter periplasmic adaptor subunit [Actinophytocola sp.]